MELADIRKEIDEIDSQLLPLFLRRMKCAEQVAAVKKEKNLPVFNAQREQEILDRAAEKAGEYGQAVRGIYSTMMSVKTISMGIHRGTSKIMMNACTSSSTVLQINRNAPIFMWINRRVSNARSRNTTR